MRAGVPDLWEKGRVRERAGGYYPYCPGTWYGRFVVRGPLGDFLLVITSGADAWAEAGLGGPPFEHASVTVRGSDRCPTWGEMCWVKDQVWDPEELVVQYHPPRSRYVSHHPTCLHLWKPVGVDLPLPPTAAVGPLAGGAA